VNEIILGDSMSIGSHLAQLGREVNCVITDPPYGLNYESNQATTPVAKKYARKLDADNDPSLALGLFSNVMDEIIPFLADEADLYVFGGWSTLDHWWPNLTNSFYNSHGVTIDLKMVLVWAKGWPGQGDLVANWGCGHEFIYYLKKGRRPVHHRRSAILNYDSDIDAEIALTEMRLDYLRAIKNGEMNLGPREEGIVRIDKPATMQHIHPTEKPVALIEELVRMSTNPGDLIVDPFSGSGSTSVAAMNHGRDSLAMEIDPDYWKASNTRLSQGSLFSA
jgi:adenine-specific DNA-methyltransferase